MSRSLIDFIRQFILFLLIRRLIHIIRQLIFLVRQLIFSPTRNHNKTFFLISKVFILNRQRSHIECDWGSSTQNRLYYH